jgi:cytochrome c oxidase subunit 4
LETAYYIAFGAHGPRALPPPGEGWKVAGYTALGVGVSFALFVVIRLFAKGSPGTMNKEYQEATNEYLKVCFPDVPLALASTGRGSRKDVSCGKCRKIDC